LDDVNRIFEEAGSHDFYKGIMHFITAISDGYWAVTRSGMGLKANINVEVLEFCKGC